MITSIFILLFTFLGFTLAEDYPDCTQSCDVYYVDDREWGVENGDWCVIQSNCKSQAVASECFSFPQYPCCEGCDVYEEDSDGLWGIEKNSWCGIKDSCIAGTTDKATDDSAVQSGWYTIKNTGSNKYLQVNGKGSAGANVVIGSNADKWKITSLGDGYITITSMYGDFNIEVKGSDDSNGANIQINTASKENSQQFIVQATSTSDVYTLGSKITRGSRVLDVESARTTDGSNVLQWDNSQKPNQTWVIEATSAPSEEEINPPKPVSNFKYESMMQYRDAPQQYLGPCQQQGKIVKEEYDGINGHNSLLVYTPFGYDPSQQYNIFYLMHGGGENEGTIFSRDVELQNILDHMIMNGDLEPLIVVTPTFNKCEAQTFYKEFRESAIPFVEGKYSTYAKSTSPDDIAASRYHRAYGGFSMGSASTWAVVLNCLDIVAYFMPLSGDNWEATGYNKAKSVADAVNKFGLKPDEFFIFAATGSEDIAYPNMNPQMDDMKKMEPFIYTSDFSKGNFYYLVAPGKTHWWGYVKHYIYDALPSFFHEHQ